MASDLASKVAGLNPFGSKNKGKGKGKIEEDDQGEGIDARGAGSRVYHGVSRREIRISPALKSYLVQNKTLSEDEADADNEGNTTEGLRRFVERPYVNIPRSATDFSHKLPDYFISSSHNTYLMAHQLYGTTCASAYEAAIKAGSRCVEIDAWDNSDHPDEPKVTHGYTLVSNIPFRLVCETLRNIYDEEREEADKKVHTDCPALTPIIISLENHCGAKGQKRLVEIMLEVLGDRLLAKPMVIGSKEHIPLAQLGHKIVVIVEFHMVGEASDDSDSSASDSPDSSDEEEDRTARKQYKDKKNQGKETSSVIIPELAELGVYAQSVKPPDNSWFETGTLANGPHHPLINVSETGLAAHLPANAVSVAKHNANHLMRVYPKGTRISSSNLKPVPFWNVGAQICALNGQNFGTSNQINDALFIGTGGYVLKPAPLREGGSGTLSTGRKVTLRLHLAGASDVPIPKGVDADDLRPYASCTLFHVDNMGRDPPKRRTSPYKPSKLGFLHKGGSPPSTDPVWDEVLEWEYDYNELTFIRILIKNDVSWAGNSNMLTLAVRLSYVTQGWTLLRMLDLKGNDTACSILAKFEFVDA
ncbi:PLCYc [Geosmithia morbida]|uniref:Phosphoinositide phospholipase C n=1 Tax=Geosmithia morbida TaxID=1094350 RepID=A0A9P5D7V6_9HYPO|nr:PLCYc [Geosmithia morbida]KAF4127021.1 PLCYc [Geosmithia morbida]